MSDTSSLSLLNAYWTLPVEILERETSSMDEKSAAINALSDLLQRHEDELNDNDGLAERILRACMSETLQRPHDAVPSDAEINFKLVVVVCRVVMEMDDYEDAISEMINHERVIPWIIEGVHSEHDDLHYQCVYAIYLLCTCATARPEDLTTFIVRYATTIREAMINTMGRTLTHEAMWDDEWCLEMAGLLAMAPDHLRAWVFRWTKECPEDVSNVIIRVFEVCLDSPSTLLTLVQYGLMHIASRFFCSLPVDRANDDHAEVFRRVLIVLPQFNDQFRVCTMNGVLGNPTAALGQSIAPRVMGRGCYYIFNEEGLD